MNRAHLRYSFAGVFFLFLLFAPSTSLRGQAEAPETYLGIPGAEWTEWLNRDGPSGSGDFEGLRAHLENGDACPEPADIECRTVTGEGWTTAQQSMACQRSSGAVCRNADQTDGRRCLDYEVRFLCPIGASAGDEGRFDWIQQRRSGANGSTRGALEADFEHARRSIESPTEIVFFDESSEELGGWYSLQARSHPGFRFTNSRRARGVGRIGSLTRDPNAPWRVFATSPVGGLWWARVAQNLWAPAGTDQGLPRSGVSSVAIGVQSPPGSRCDQDVWFVSSGDTTPPTQRGASKVWQWSDGVFRSVDRGQTWQYIGLGRSGPYHRNTIRKILSDPEDCEVLYAATNDGLKMTENALDPEPAWETLHGGIVNDIEINPHDLDGGRTLLIAGSIHMTMNTVPPSPDVESFYPFIARRSDLGGSWEHFALPPEVDVTSIPLIELEFSSSRPQIVYALATSNHERTHDFLIEIDLEPVPWRQHANVVNASIHALRLGTLAVSPSDHREVIIGDVHPLLKSTDGGRTFGAIGNVTYHDDQQDVLYLSDDRLLVATDGGVYRSEDGGATWTPKNRNLVVQTIDGLDVTRDDDGSLYMLYGAFDLGSYLQVGTQRAEHVLGGDGRHCEIAPSDPNVMYVSHQSGGIRKTTDRWQTNEGRLSVPKPYWGTYFAVDSGNADVVYGASQEGVYRYAPDEGWTLHSSAMVKNIYKVWTVDTDPNVIYASTVWLKSDDATSPGGTKLYRSMSRGGTLTTDWIDLNLPKGRGWLSEIAVDETDPQRIWAAFPASTGPRIFGFNGLVWSDITGDLPAGERVQTILRDRQRADDRLYIGTDYGNVYALVDGSWKDLSANLPNVSIHHLAQTERFIFAGTFGRGIWSQLKLGADPGPGGVKPVSETPTTGNSSPLDFRR